MPIAARMEHPKEIIPEDLRDRLWLWLSLPGHRGTSVKGTAQSREYITVFSIPF